MEAEYCRGRSVVCALHVHLVFVTKYRRGVFTDRAHAVLKDAFLGVCAKFNAVLKEVNGEADHVHLLIEYLPTVQLSRLVNILKGVSSRLLRKQNFPEVRRKLWGDHLWSPSYFAASCGGAPLEIVKQYIELQREEKPEKRKENAPIPALNDRVCGAKIWINVALGPMAVGRSSRTMGSNRGVATSANKTVARLVPEQYGGHRHARNNLKRGEGHSSWTLPVPLIGGFGLATASARRQCSVRT